MNCRRLIILFNTFLCPLGLFATHNRAGEIVVKQISDFEIEATVITYTKASSAEADRDTISIMWGDGVTTNVARSNLSGILLGNDIKKNLYTSRHIYPGRGRYTIGFLDPNRISDILNVDPPNSVDVPFYVQTTINILNPIFQGKNNTVTLLQDPIDFACVGQLFQHNPSAFDIDGDSLSFELSVPMMDVNLPVPNYSYPDKIQAGPLNQISLDPRFGTFTWNTPQKAGEYNIVILVHEFRSGVLISTTMRDMQILVKDDCIKNTPPKIVAHTDTCIIAGTLLKIPVQISDPDLQFFGRRVKVSFTGSPFTLSGSASHDFLSGYQNSPLAGQISWQTNCDHVRKEYYSIVIKAVDNLFDTSGATAIHVIRIRIVGAPPILDSVVSKEKVNFVHWHKPYTCGDAKGFLGFSIWRKEGNSNIQQDSCYPSLVPYNYQRIAYLVNSTLNDSYFYKDSLIDEGVNYCYRIEAIFGELSAAMFPYNLNNSFASNELCKNGVDDYLILSNVDVSETALNSGKIFVSWKKADTLAIDTSVFTPPYELNVYKRSLSSNFSNVPILTYYYSSISEITDSNFVDQSLNTLDSQFTYRLVLKSSLLLNRASLQAQSVYCNAETGNGKIVLKWTESVPWDNQFYRIFRKEINTANFTLIDSVKNRKYTDSTVSVGQEYCYYVQSVGYINLPTQKYLTINNSNIKCISVVDTLPPCCALIQIDDPCAQDIDQNNNITYRIKWNDPNFNCNLKPSSSFKLKVFQLDSKQVIDSFSFQYPNAFQFDYSYRFDKPVCFEMTTFDSIGNSCVSSQWVCSKLCIEYELPNTFSPNFDQKNDMFVPRKSRLIRSVDFKVLNQWGGMVFKTNDPQINWDGNDLDGKALSPGTYYYHCKVIPYQTETGEGIPFDLTGFIELIRN